jgi:nicotinamidase-related amidase
LSWAAKGAYFAGLLAARLVSSSAAVRQWPAWGLLALVFGHHKRLQVWIAHRPLCQSGVRPEHGAGAGKRPAAGIHVKHCENREERNMSAMLKNTLLAFAIGIALGAPSNAVAQTATTTPSVLSTGGGQALLDTSDSVFLLLDHQAGLFQTVKDVPLIDLRANVVMLAKLATLLKIPMITTASEPNGPNGPLMPEIHQYAPHAVYVPRKGEVNAWDNEDFVKAVRATGKKTLIMAGVWTSVCVMFPALDAKAAGFKVYAVMDASGDPSEMASRTTLARFIQGGIVPTSTNAVLSETHRTWNRPEAADLAKLYALAAPNYAAVIESYQKAQEVAKASR